MKIKGNLSSVDQYLNIKLLDVSMENIKEYPYMVSDQCVFLFLRLPSKTVLSVAQLSDMSLCRPHR